MLRQVVGQMRGVWQDVFLVFLEGLGEVFAGAE